MGVSNFLNVIVYLVVFFGVTGFLLQKVISMTSRDIRAKEPLAKRIIKAGVDVFSPVGNPEANIRAIYSFGRDKARRDGDSLVFRTKMGWRIGVFPVAALLLYFTFSFQIEDGPITVPGIILAFAIVALVIWVIFYAFVFRVEIKGNALRCMSPTFAVVSHDLALLARAEDFDDSYKLHFTDGSSAAIPRFIEGHDTLKRIVVEALHTNGR